VYGKKEPSHRSIQRVLQRHRQSQWNVFRNQYNEIDRFMAAFEAAHRELYRVPSNIRYHNGWYYLYGKRYLHHHIERKLSGMIAKLRAYENPEESSDGQRGDEAA
jgi:hypothetical protein